MQNLHRAFVLVSVAALSVMGCKKEAEPELITVSSATPATVASDSAPAADTVASAEAPKPVPMPVTHTTATAPVKGESIDACCAALSAVERSGRDAATKAKYRQAAAVCPGIAALVKSGKTQRGPGLAQVKSALAGTSAPAECN